MDIEAEVPIEREPDPLAAVRSDHGCFGCGGRNPIGLHLRFHTTASGVTADFTPSPAHQGFADIVHGGIISTVLDEAMAWATAAAGLWTVTGEMRVRFRRPLPVGAPTRVTARVTEIRGRLVKTTAELVLAADGSTIATGSASFVRVAERVEAAWRTRYLDQPTSDVENPQDAIVDFTRQRADG